MNSDSTTSSLIEVARAAREDAYAPYSDFLMGAAVQCADGRSFPGVLIENVSLGLAMCAERVALFSARAGGGRPVGLALVSARTEGRLTWPCGACLQVALELGGPSLTVSVGDLNGAIEQATLDELLPRGPHRSDVAGTKK